MDDVSVEVEVLDDVQLKTQFALRSLSFDGHVIGQLGRWEEVVNLRRIIIECLTMTTYW